MPINPSSMTSPGTTVVTTGSSSAALRNGMSRAVLDSVNSRGPAVRPGAWASFAPIPVPSPSAMNRQFVDGWRNRT